MQRLIAIAALATLLAGCQTTAGSGPLMFQSGIQAIVEAIQKADPSAYIAVTARGDEFGTSSCSLRVDRNCAGGNGPDIAIRDCELRSRGRSCYIYAHGSTVLWNFEAPSPEGVTRIVPGHRLTLRLDRNTRNILFSIDWNPSATLGRLSGYNNNTAPSGCIGEITREGASFKGLWEIACDTGESYAGTVRFGEAAIVGWGKETSGADVEIKID